MTLGGVAAIALGLVLLLSGALKLTAMSAWRTQARALGVPSAVAVVVPVVELSLGALMVVGWGRRLAALAAAVLLVGFTVFLVRLLRSGRAAPCACFGSLSRRPVGWGSVARNLGLIALAVVVVAFA